MASHGVAGRPACDEHGCTDDALHRHDFQKEPWIVAFSAVRTAHEGVQCAATAEIECAYFSHPGLRAPPLLEDVRLAPGPPHLWARGRDETHDLKVQLRVAPPGPAPFDEIKGAFTEFLPF
jgi:hypothetical protein